MKKIYESVWFDNDDLNSESFEVLQKFQDMDRIILKEYYHNTINIYQDDENIFMVKFEEVNDEIIMTVYDLS